MHTWDDFDSKKCYKNKKVFNFNRGGRDTLAALNGGSFENSLHLSTAGSIVIHKGKEYIKKCLGNNRNYEYWEYCETNGC